MKAWRSWQLKENDKGPEDPNNSQSENWKSTKGHFQTFHSPSSDKGRSLQGRPSRQTSCSAAPRIPEGPAGYESWCPASGQGYFNISLSVFVCGSTDETSFEPAQPLLMRPCKITSSHR